MKKVYSILCLVCIAHYCFAADDITHIRPKTASLDIELSQVAVSIVAFDGETIAYRYDLKKGAKLSVTETQRTLRVRQLMPSEGTLFLYIPQKQLLESMLIRLNRSHFHADGVQTVHSLIMMNSGHVNVQNTTLKNAVINVAQGTLTFNSTMLNSCALSLTDCRADIVFCQPPDKIYLDYSKINSTFSINGAEQIAAIGNFGNPRGKTSIILSAASSTASVAFQTKEQEIAKN